MSLYWQKKLPVKCLLTGILKKYIIHLAHFSTSTVKIFLKTHTEKISYIFSKESFSYIYGNGTLHFSAQAQKIKNSNWRKFLTHQETETPKKLLIFFSKENCSYVSADRDPKKIPYISGNFLYFRK